MEFIVKYIVVFLVGLVAAWLLVPLVKKIAPFLGLVDMPSDRRIHKTPIPRCGGIAVFVATHLALAVVFFGPWHELAGSIQLPEWIVLFAGSLALLLIGLIDDRFGMRAWFKLFGQLAVSLLMYLCGFSFGAFLHIELPVLVDLGATLFWFILLINAFNLIDGIDGACAGLGLIASAGLAGMLFSLHQPSDALVLVALIGACLGFLRYNFSPASVFLGDCGSMGIGIFGRLRKHVYRVHAGGGFAEGQCEAIDDAGLAGSVAGRGDPGVRCHSGRVAAYGPQAGFNDPE